jgi:hypothetical protein
MAPIQVALHTQSLEDVMLELERCENPLAGHAFSLAKDGALHPLKEETLETLRNKNVFVFNANIWDSLILSDQADMSLTALPTPQQLQNIMMKDIGSDNYFSFGPLRATPELNAHATLSSSKTLRILSTMSVELLFICLRLH